MNKARLIKKVSKKKLKNNNIKQDKKLIMTINLQKQYFK